jgi:branched-chain amino acid transport system substrate-binding protein
LIVVALARAVRGTPVALAASLWALGCNAVVDTSTEQCEKDADCAAKGPAFAGTFCTAEKVCGALPCTSSAQCSTRLGEPGWCRRDSTCTKVLTPECTEIVPQGALSKNEVILAGFMGPIKKGHANESYALPLRQGAEHALAEIENVNGLPRVEGGEQRHLAMLVCHDNEKRLEVARHLAHQVKVPVIIGPSFSGVTIAITTDVTIPAGVLALSPSATSPEITGLDDRGLVWRTAPSDEIQAETLLLLLEATEKALTPPLQTGERARVAYTVRDDSYGKGISEAFIRLAVRRGTSDVQNFRGTNYDPEDSESDETVTDNVAANVASTKPHIVIGFGTNEFATKVLPKIEARLAADAPKPRYLIPEGVRVTELLETVGGRTELKQRILGTAPGARQSDQFDNFSVNFTLRFNQQPGNLAEFAYDAVYLFAYATGLSRRRSPTGSELAAALKSVSCKNVVPKVIPGDNVAASLGRAMTEPCIDFEGASGSLDFNNDSGEAPSDIALWCPDATAKIFKPLQAVYYNASEGQLAYPTPSMSVPEVWTEVAKTCQ